LRSQGAVFHKRKPKDQATAGTLLDWGITVRMLAGATGLMALLPAVAWSFGLRLWKTAP